MAGAALLAQLVEHLHGKEGVDGSSPSEGFTKASKWPFFLAGERCDLRYVGHRSVPKTCPHRRAVSSLLALTDASEATEHLHEVVRRSQLVRLIVLGSGA
jgi:hypothetical protein